MLERDTPVNWSTLRWIGVSPRHYLHRLNNPSEQTDAMRFGIALHYRVYELEKFEAIYVVMPRFHGGCNDDTAREKGYEGGKQAKAAWEAAHRTHEIITAEDLARIEGCNASLKSDPIAAPYVIGGNVEQTIEWIDELTGIACRGRLDRYDERALSDLKGTANIEPRSVARQVGSLGYHAKMAFYHDGLLANGIVLPDPTALVFVETQPPHDTLVLEFTEDDLATGRAVYRRALSILDECRKTGHWPGVSGGVKRRVEIPAWASPEEEEITMGGERLF